MGLLQDGFDNDRTTLVMSAFYGIRQWRVDTIPGPDGEPARRIRSVAMDYRWTPGGNLARCTRIVCSCIKAMGETTVPTGFKHDNGCHKVRIHDRPAQPKCNCGFWAYSNTTEDWYHDHHPQSRWGSQIHYVQGVIEASGMVTVGTLGFRCERARIVALVGIAESTNPLPDWMVNPRAIEAQALLSYGIESDLRKFWAEAGQSLAWYPTREAMLAEWPLTDLNQYRKELA